MANSFQETVKIYQQGKAYYDGLRKVKNLVRDARKVQQTILMVGDITDKMCIRDRVCIGFGVVSASVLVWVTFRMNSKYGEWGLMKLLSLIHI